MDYSAFIFFIQPRFRGRGNNPYINFVGFLKTPKFPFQINWPLLCSSSPKTLFWGPKLNDFFSCSTCRNSFEKKSQWYCILLYLYDICNWNGSVGFLSLFCILWLCRLTKIVFDREHVRQYWRAVYGTLRYEKKNAKRNSIKLLFIIFLHL